VGYDHDWRLFDQRARRNFNVLFAFNDMGLFVGENTTTLLDGTPVDYVHVEYAPGFSESSFEFTGEGPIPIILSENVMRQRGVMPGDAVYIVYAIPIRSRHVWTPIPAVVIGVHNRHIIRRQFADAVLMPLSALEYIKGEEIGYVTLRFNVDPQQSRDLRAIREELTGFLRQHSLSWGSIRLRLNVQDGELRSVVGHMEQNLSLLRLLYPVAIVLSVIIGFGLSLLLILQNAKNAAIMRMLGLTLKRTQSALCSEQLTVCLGGIVIGLIALTILGWSIAVSFMPAGLYLAGVIIGSITGSILVTNRPPLELLQVRE
jgi:hypothetical protein